MSDTLSDVAEKAQRFVSLRPVIILGSGASVPHGLPSMVELAKTLAKRLPDNSKGSRDVKAALSGGQDLEQVLQQHAISPDLLKRIVECTWDAINLKDRHVLQDVISSSRRLPLADLLKYLLRTANPSINIITTNYDRLAEYAGAQAGIEPFCGFGRGHIGLFQPPLFSFQRPPQNRHPLTILKVHGSLDWFGDSSRNPISWVNADQIPRSYSPLIVTPGLTKYREAFTEPFRTIIFHADDALVQASSFLAIGFGFNDDHIQPKIQERVTKDNVPLIILAKSLTQKVHTSFLASPVKEFLFLEQCGNGTRAYTPKHPKGETLPNSNLWTLPGFISLVTGS